MKWLGILFLSTFVGLMFFSLIHLPDNHHKTTVSDYQVAKCPFMTHEEVLCPMNLFDHIKAWKAIFFNLIPSALTLLSIALLIASTVPHLLKKHLLYLMPIRKCRPPSDTYTYTIRAFQELFSNGILHPKIF